MATLDLKAFTPSREDPDRLDARTVGRDGVLDTLHRRFRQAATSGNRQHTLIVGARGAGKSHVLEVALHRASLDPVTAAALRIARLPEDAIGVSTAADVLLHTVVSLDAPSHVLDAARSARAARDLVALEQMAATIAGDQVLVLVVENLDRVFSALGPAGQSDLRAWIETCKQVLVLATAPLLFHAVQSRSAPWYGSFGIEHLDGLSISDATTLVHTIARQLGETELASFVTTPHGQARLEAVHHLAGDSPRIWMIFASCLSIASLDALVPAVEALLEELVPFYQQRLWELPGNEQKLLNELALTVPTATVADLAHLAGLEQRVAGTTIRRLERAGWVRGRKMPGTDQRTTWYELREPLLRHHLQYRDNRGEELRLIVDFLRVWFARSERRQHLLTSTEGSVVERYMALTITLEPDRRFDSSYADRDIEALQETGRLWASGRTEDVGTVEAGAIIDAICKATRGAVNPRSGPRSGAAQHVIETLSFDCADDEAYDVADQVGRALDAAAAMLAGPSHTPIELIAACWNGAASPVIAVARLERLSSNSDFQPSRLRMAARCELAYWYGEAGRVDEAITAFETLIDDQARVLGADHPDTLNSRSNRAYLLGQAGRVDEAITAFETVIDDRTRILGADHVETLGAVIALASLRVRSGRLHTIVGEQPGGDPFHLLRLVAFEGSADALARIPVELRSLVDKAYRSGLSAER